MSVYMLLDTPSIQVTIKNVIFIFIFLYIWIASYNIALLWGKKVIYQYSLDFLLLFGLH